jgi:hypothetical protein
LADSCPLWYLCSFVSICSFPSLPSFISSWSPCSELLSRATSRHFFPPSPHIAELTYCEYPSCISSLSCRILCICPLAAFPAQSASPSSTCRPSSCSVPSLTAHCRVLQQCRQRFVGARVVGTSGGGTGARGFSFSMVSSCPHRKPRRWTGLISEGWEGAHQSRPPDSGFVRRKGPNIVDARLRDAEQCAMEDAKDSRGLAWRASLSSVGQHIVEHRDHHK